MHASGLGVSGRVDPVFDKHRGMRGTGMRPGLEVGTWRVLGSPALGAASFVIDTHTTSTGSETPPFPTEVLLTAGRHRDPERLW